MDPVNNMEFMKFSDQIRLQTTNLAALSIGDSIWSDPNPADRRNLDTGWKSGFGLGLATQKLAFGNNNSIRYNNSNSNSNDVLLGSSKNSSDAYINNGDMKNYFNKAIGKPIFGGDVNGNGKKKSNNNGETKGMGKKKNTNNNGNDNNGGAADKRFKTLPPTEALPRSEPVGGYIFVCNNDTMQENLKRQLFGLPPRYRDSVRAITPGLPLFLYNYSTHQLHGIFEAASFGGSNIDPTAWEDKKCPGESRFPAQVRVMTRKICGALEEDSFRPILHHYDGPKFRLELSVPEALALLDIFAENIA